MSIAICYSSPSGSTQTVAEAMRDALEAHATMQDVGRGAMDCVDTGAALPDENDCAERVIYFGPPAEPALTADTILIGFWNDKSDVDAATAAFLGQCSGRQIALFMTSGSIKADYLEKVWANIDAALPEDVTVLSRFACQGRMLPAVRQKYERQRTEGDPRADERIAHFDEALNHPDAADLRAAEDWAIGLFT